MVSSAEKFAEASLCLKVVSIGLIVCERVHATPLFQDRFIACYLQSN